MKLGDGKVCARCELLEEELAAAKDALRHRDRETELVIVRQAFDCTRQHARLIMRLYMAKSNYLPNELLLRDVIGSEAVPSGVKTIVCMARKRPKIGPTGIESLHGSGYRLSPAMRDKVRALLEDAREYA